MVRSSQDTGPSGRSLLSLPYEAENEAIAIANNSTYGPSRAVFIRDVERALAVAQCHETGTVELHGSLAGIQAPMSGVKYSGLCRKVEPEGRARS
jgi:acyl-CoA reductase-like NAD-dependent aldehyde dehydrogenase